MKVFLVSVLIIGILGALNLDINHKGKYLKIKLTTSSRQDKTK